MSASVRVSPASAHQWTEALRLVFQYCAREECAERVHFARASIQRGELDPAGLFVAQHGTTLVGAMICQLLPGASALVWPPQAIADAISDLVEDLLVEHAGSWLRRQGAKLAQAVLDREAACLGAALERNGFRHVTQLEYMRHFLDFSTEVLASEERLTYDSYESANPAAFHATLLRTYENTADFPEINGVREIDEIIAGHRAQGMHNPEHWWLASLRARLVGVVILAPMKDCWDLSYVGVVPQARGNGLGRELVCKALLETRTAEIPQLTLTVDARNQPARHLYRRLGFELYETREVFLAIWKRPAATSGSG